MIGAQRGESPGSSQQREESPPARRPCAMLERKQRQRASPREHTPRGREAGVPSNNRSRLEGKSENLLAKKKDRSASRRAGSVRIAVVGKGRPPFR